MDVYIIVGALFGDESKGSFVNVLCSKVKKPLVVRFNGGHQVGHTVVHNGQRHVFSNFGSGTLQGVPTYWSEYCTVDPIGVKVEGKVLRDMGHEPMVFYNSNVMVTTPFDIIMNQNNERNNNHGSVGVGFGQTIQRNEDYYHLYVRDLKYPYIRDAKIMNIIKEYYKLTDNDESKLKKLTTKKIYVDFIKACDELVAKYKIVDGLKGFYDHNLIFEGGQGIMLDQHYGFFPNVTRSNTTAKNAISIIDTIPFKVNVMTYYITRAYQCRHGNGYMTNEEYDTSYIIDNPNETNVSSIWQGVFRKSVLDLNMLKYAIECDTHENPDSTKRMVITCLDQVPEDIPVTIDGELQKVRRSEIGKFCNIFGIDYSWSDEGVVL